MTLNATINKAMLTFLVPPPVDRPFQSWRALVYTKIKPEKVFHGTRTYISSLSPDEDIMKRELCDPDHTPAFFIQLTDKDQYVYIEGDVHEILSTEVHLADKSTDKYVSRTTLYKEEDENSEPIPKLILPGAGNKAPVPSVPITDDVDVFVVDISFKTHPLKKEDNAELIAQAKAVAWSHGVSF